MIGDKCWAEYEFSEVSMAWFVGDFLVKARNMVGQLINEIREYRQNKRVKV